MNETFKTGDLVVVRNSSPYYRIENFCNVIFVITSKRSYECVRTKSINLKEPISFLFFTHEIEIF